MNGAVKMRKNRKDSTQEKMLNRTRRNCNKFNQLDGLSLTVSGEVFAVCIACGVTFFINCSYDLKRAHASHYWNDDQYSSVRFDSDNIFLCCAKCNRPQGLGGKSGNLSEFKVGIIKEIGIERFEALELRRNVIKKWTISELEVLNKQFLAEIKKLKIELGEVVC